MQLQEGRIPLNQSEQDTVEAMMIKYPDQPISMTRRDPDEKGPLLIHVGDDTYVVDAP